MTSTEFSAWLTTHAALFKGFADWMLSPAESAEIVDIRQQEWFNALEPFPLDDVTAASRRLWMRPVDQRPTGYSDHLSALVEIMRQQRREPAAIHGRPVRCRRCKDSGRVDALPREGFRFRSAAGYPIPHHKPITVYCDCPAAPVNIPDGGLARWDETRMTELPPPDPAKSWQIIAQAREHGHNRQADAWERYLNGGPLPAAALANVVKTPPAEPAQTKGT